MMFVFLLALLWWNGSAAETVIEARRKPEPGRLTANTKPRADMPACVRSFIQSQIVEASGNKISAGELYAAHVTTVTGEPVSRNKFGRIVGRVYAKDGASYPSYVGVALHGPRLVAAVVAAG